MPTHTQDPVDRFSTRIAELRRVPRVRGPAGPVLNLLLDLFVSMLELFTCLAEQVRTGQLPVTAPSPRGGRIAATGERACSDARSAARQAAAAWRLAGAPDPRGRVGRRHDARAVRAAGDKRADRRGTAGKPHFAAAMRHAGGRAAAAATCGRRDVAAMARTRNTLDYGRRVFAVRFEKMGLRGTV
jgi:hypothetical protein